MQQKTCGMWIAWCAHLIQMPDVGRGLAVAMQLQIVGEEVEEGLEQRPLRVEDEAPVGVAEQPDVLNVKYVAA